MHVVSWETNKTRFSKYTLPQIGENQNCPTWVRSPLQDYRSGQNDVVPNGAVFDRPALGLFAGKVRTTVVIKLAGIFYSSEICMCISS